jgi:hypothetical protein
MTHKEALSIVGGLSKPSKMPGKAYNLPAQECKVGGQLHKQKGTVCSGCYARKGRYSFPDVQAALYRRLDAIKDPRWVEAMVWLLQKETYFRWHDSGDLQGEWHLHKIVDVALRTPHVRHWLPTKEYKLVKEWKEPFPDNLCVRVSLPLMGMPKTEPKWDNYSIVIPKKEAVDNPEALCHAQESGTNVCGPCRKCWSKDVRYVIYRRH